MSSRERVPTTGRSNRAEVDSSRSRRPSTASPATVASSSSAANDARVSYNDPLRFFRPFSPRDPNFPEKPPTRPFLPKSFMEPTIPPLDAPPRYKKPAICPDSWKYDAQKPDPFERSNLDEQLTKSDKIKHCRAFIERNESDLWKYDREYAKKTPRTLCNDLVESRNFSAIMTQNYQRERKLRLSSSEGTRRCLSFDPSPLERYENPAAYNDPYMASMTTSRRTKEERLQSLLAPQLAAPERRFNRGYDHAPEYGNFSKYNSVLKTNKSGVLNR